jgi:PKD repeat protein
VNREGTTIRWLGVLLALAMLVGLLPTLVVPQPVAAAATTSLTVTKYDAHGAALGTQTVDYLWMEANLPVQGDGAMYYYTQGPTFDATDFNSVWNPGEDVNVGTLDRHYCPKGTDVKDLCNLVGGAGPGCTIKIKALDNFAKWFDYEDVYNPEPRQGKLVVCWYDAESGGYVPDYSAGMRLIFFADTSTNPDGWHVFGDWDMHETLPESRWHYYSGQWPSSSGLSVQTVSNIDVYEPNLISCDASGAGKDSFSPGETVYVKGLGLAASTSYKLWIQAEPVSNNKLTIAGGEDSVLQGAQQLSVVSDPSAAQETIATDASGDFSVTAIWAIDSAADTSVKYDIVADSQASGVVGKYDTYTPGSSSPKDFIDSPGWQGFTVANPSAPVAAFSADVVRGPVPLTVHFTDRSTGNPTSWAWDFNNDGTVDSTDQNPSHTYTAAGTYTVRLTVANSADSDDEVKTYYIMVAPPTYTITASAGANGSIDPSGDVTVSYGGSQIFTITADTGYHIADVLVDGASVSSATSGTFMNVTAHHTFVNVTANHTISASFAPNQTAADCDLNADQVCNICDVVVIGLHWGETGGAGWIAPDLNRDGVVDMLDVAIIEPYWGQTWK